MSIYTKLSNIQKELIAPKGQFNAFGKYSYRSCEDILKALKPLCDSNNCVCFITNELENIGSNNYVKAIVTLADLESGETIVSTAHAREEETKKGMDGSQITGASSSYARKYALAGLFCIDNEKDSDATNLGDNTKPTAKKDSVVEEAELRAKVLKVIADNKYTKDYVTKLCNHYGVKALNELTADNCKDYLKALEDKRNE